MFEIHPPIQVPVVPLPVYPAIHVHVKLPLGVLEQSASVSSRGVARRVWGVGRAVLPGGGILKKLYVFFLNFFNNHYFAISFNRKSFYCVAQCPGSKLRKLACHLVYVSMCFSKYNKDLILMLNVSQLQTVFFFVFGLFDLPCPLFGNVIRY